MKKGQIISLDSLSAVLLITVIIGLVTITFQQVYLKADDLNYRELKTLADDWANIGVKNLLATNSLSEPNKIDTAKLSILTNEMTTAFTGTGIAFEVSLGENPALTECDLKDNIAISKRVYFDGTNTGELVVKVCR